MGIGVLYYVISKLKFYSKNNYQKTLHFKSVLLFSSIFNQSVPPAVEQFNSSNLFLATAEQLLCMSHTGNSTTAQLQLPCNHTQIMEHHYYYSNYGT